MKPSDVNLSLATFFDDALGVVDTPKSRQLDHCFFVSFKLVVGGVVENIFIRSLMEEELSLLPVLFSRAGRRLLLPGGVIEDISGGNDVTTAFFRNLTGQVWGAVVGGDGGSIGGGGAPTC